MDALPDADEGAVTPATGAAPVPPAAAPPRPSAADPAAAERPLRVSTYTPPPAAALPAPPVAPESGAPAGGDKLAQLLERDEVQVGLAFAGAFVGAQILRRLVG